MMVTYLKLQTTHNVQSVTGVQQWMEEILNCDRWVIFSKNYKIIKSAESWRQYLRQDKEMWASYLYKTVTSAQCVYLILRQLPIKIFSLRKEAVENVVVQL